jgi:uronate dehydrogenase
MKKLVLTGAAGALGSRLRALLKKMCDELVSTDIVDDIGTLQDGETYVQADLSSLDAMLKIIEGADMVVHFGAIADEAAWDDILQSNIIGA